MRLTDYQAALRKLKWPMGLALFGPMIPGMAGALYLTSRLAASSSWDPAWVCVSMFPTLIAPILIAAMIAEQLDKRIGIHCECGQSLSFGKHVKALMEEGGKCPRCGRVAVEA